MGFKMKGFNPGKGTGMGSAFTDSAFLKRKRKSAEISIPEIDLSGLENAISSLTAKIISMETSLKDYEERLNTVEKNSGGRF